MAYGGRANVTKEIVVFVKANRHVSNYELNQRIQSRFGCSFADSTYDRIRNGEYDRKFNLNNENNDYSAQYYSRPKRKSVKYNTYYNNTNIYGSQRQSSVRNSYSDNSYNTGNSSSNSSYKDNDNSSAPISGKRYLAAFCTGGLGIYGLFHGATPLGNPGAFIIAVGLIFIGIICLSGKGE